VYQSVPSSSCVSGCVGFSSVKKPTHLAKTADLNPLWRLEHLAAISCKNPFCRIFLAFASFVALVQT